jgi:hypothetical protein
MSNIFNFRPGKKETHDSDFLKDNDDTVEFVHSGKDVHIGEAPKHFLNPGYADMLLRDWSNQELANVYRVKKLLDAAGVPNELERGISDEGDPWCIFCSLTGEVFIHLSRIDGGYVLDSPNLRAPIFGTDFAELIQEFSAGALGTSPAAEKGNRRVIKLHRNGKVFLHPSALLAALVWSIYLNSEDLVMFAPEDETLDGSAGNDAIALVNEMAMAPLTVGDAGAAPFLETTVQPDQMITTRLADAGIVRDAGLVKDIYGKMTMIAAHTPIAVGLSSIAIAFGIMSEGFFDPATPDVITTPDMLAAAAVADITLAEREQESAARGPQFDLIAVLQSAFNHAPATPEQMQSALSIEIAGDVDLSTLLASVLPPAEQAGIDINLKGAFEKSWAELGLQEAVLYAEAREKQHAKTADKLNTETQTTTAAKQENAPENADIVITSAKVDPVLDLASLTAFKAYTASAFQTFDFGGVMVEATFDIASLSPDTTSLLGPWSDPSVDTLGMNDLTDTDTIDLGPVNDNPFTSAPGFDLIDASAQAFIEYLIGRDTGVEMISRPTEFVLLDFSALTSGQATHSMGWELEDGNTIFTVGLRSDFIEYDLIA